MRPPVHCPFCGDDELHLDILFNSADDALLDWLPCCEEASDLVGEHGWEAFAGAALVDSLNDETGVGARAIEPEPACDDLVLWNLRGSAPGSVPGWQTTVFGLVDQHHSHHDAPTGWKAGVAVYNGRKMVGVAVLGRPNARMLQTAEPQTLEVTRVCVWGHPAQRRNAASMLYGLCGSEAKRLGANKLVTYTLAEENGASVAAAGFAPVARTKGGSWNRRSREREDNAPTTPKLRWERGLTKTTRREVAARASTFTP